MHNKKIFFLFKRGSLNKMKEWNNINLHTNKFVFEKKNNIKKTLIKKEEKNKEKCKVQALLSLESQALSYN